MQPNRLKCVEFTFFLGAFLVSLSLNFATQRYSFPNPDTNQSVLFSDLLVRNQTLWYYNELNVKYVISIFGIRSLLNFGHSYFVPSVIPGIIMIQALFKFVNLPTFLINPIFVLIGLYFFNRIANIFIFNNRPWALYTTAIYFSSGAFIHNSSLPFKDLVATTTFLAGLYYVLDGIYNKKASSFALFGFFAGVTMWMSYLNVIFYLPTLGLYLFTIRNEILKKQNLKNFIVAFAFFFPLFISLYVYQVTVFDGFLNFNNPVFRLNHYEAYEVRSSISSFVLDVDISQLPVNFFNQIFLVDPILISFSILGSLYVIYDGIKKKKVNKVLLVLLVLVALQFLFYLGKPWYGDFLKGSVVTSYSRYLLISWGVFIILSVNAIRRVIYALRVRHSRKKLVLILLFVYFVVSGLVSGLLSQWAIKYDIEVSEWSHEVRNDIIENTPKNSIIFTSYSDKHIYPVRQTAIYVSIPKEERLNKTIYLMKELLDDGYSVYLVDERDDYAISPVLSKDIFEKNGLKTERAFSNFYRITLG
jgi:hypothetical protein